MYLRWHPSSAGGSGTPAGRCRGFAASTRHRREGRLDREKSVGNFHVVGFALEGMGGLEELPFGSGADIVRISLRGEIGLKERGKGFLARTLAL